MERLHNLRRVNQATWLMLPLIVIVAFVLVEIKRETNSISIGNLDYFPLVDRGVRLSFSSSDAWVDWIQPVGFPWLIRGGLELGFDAARFGQAASIFGGVLGLIGAYLLAWAVTGSRNMALACEVFVAATGYFLFYSSFEGNDMLAAGLQILSLSVLTVGLVKAPPGSAPPLRWIILASVTAGLAYLTRYTGMITLGVGLLVLMGLALYHRSRAIWKTLVVYVIVFVGVTALQWIPSWIITGSPMSNDQGKNVWFHVYGKSDFITAWNDAPNITLMQVITQNPVKVLRHWWDVFQGFWLSPQLAIAEIPLKLFGQVGFLFMLLAGKPIRWSLRILLGLFVFLHLAALSLMRLDPRFLMIMIPILDLGALYFFWRILPATWRFRRIGVPVQALALIIGLLIALPVLFGFADYAPATSPSLIAANDALHAAGMQAATEVLSTDLSLQDLSALSRARFTQANDNRSIAHDTLQDLLAAAQARQFRFLIYDADTGPKLYPELKGLLAPESRPVGLTPIYIEPDRKFVIYRIEDAGVSPHPPFAAFETGLALSAYQINVSRPITDTVNRDVGIFLSWQSDRVQSASYKVFVHVIDDSGQIVAQDDGLPVLWLYPVPAWKPGEAVIDFHRVRIANIDPHKTYTMLAGLYDASSGKRLNRLDSGGQAVDDKVVLQKLDLDLR